jgi:hypothetical protein
MQKFVLEVGTKHRNHNDSGGDDTNQTEVGYTVASESVKVRHKISTTNVV